MSTNNQKVRVKKIVNFNVMHEQVVEKAKKISVNVNHSNQW